MCRTRRYIGSWFSCALCASFPKPELQTQYNFLNFWRLSQKCSTASRLTLKQKKNENLLLHRLLFQFFLNQGCSLLGMQEQYKIFLKKRKSDIFISVICFKTLQIPQTFLGVVKLKRGCRYYYYYLAIRYYIISLQCGEYYQNIDISILFFFTPLGEKIRGANHISAKKTQVVSS